MRWLTIFLCVVYVHAHAGAAPAEGIEAITRPSEDVTPAFVRSGLISKIFVKEGERVKRGQLLIQLDDAAEQAQLEQLKAEADDTLQIEAAQANLEQKKVDLKKLEQAGTAATEMEVEHARLDVKIGELSVALRRFEQEQKRRKHAEAKLQIERLKMYSPIDGTVQRIVVSEGEAAEALSKIIRLVKVDPMEIDVPVPLAEARTHLRKAQTVKIVFDEPGGENQFAEGKIENINALADATSDTLNVKVAVPNPSRRPPGEHVWVIFPPLTDSGKKSAKN